MAIIDKRRKFPQAQKKTEYADWKNVSPKGSLEVLFSVESPEQEKYLARCRY